MAYLKNREILYDIAEDMEFVGTQPPLIRSWAGLQVLEGDYEFKRLPSSNVVCIFLYVTLTKFT